MSLLPQRKKSAEEIAKLRDTLGVPGLQDEEPGEAEAQPAPDTIIARHHEATVVDHPADSPSPEPPPPARRAAKPVHSLKRSERIPEPAAGENPAPSPKLTAPLPKPVRSLRKSEQIPVMVPAPAETATDGRLPHHRHSDEQIAEIRRRDAIAMLNPPPPNPKLAAAHIAILIPGYLLAFAGTACFLFYDFPLAATAACSIAALLIAGFIFLRRPISRHHAAFIAVIALLVIVFGALHYFPHLRHAT